MLELPFPAALPALFPALFLGALALAHFVYFRLASATPVQQLVQVAEFPSGGQTSSVSRLAPVVAKPSRYRRALVLGNAFYDQPLICGCSLTVNGVALFEGPVKVSGDLLIVGRAEFSRPVVANGKVVVIGQAIFRQGLLAKSSLVIRGQASIGSAAQGAWLVARTASVAGDLWLNGEFETFGAPAQRSPARRRA